jgi:hypothetical protein
MATEVDKLLIRIEADLSGVRRQLNSLDKQVKEKTRSVSNNFNKIARVAKVALGAVVVQQAGRAGLALVNLASDVQEMQDKSSIVFGKFAEDVRKELAKFGAEVGRNRFELEGMAASIQDTFVPMGFARGEAAKLSIEVTKLATDVASLNNVADPEVMRAFQSALVGNHETVRRFGVVISEATIKQELLRMGIKRTGDEVTNMEKVQARLNLIIAGTSDAQGNAALTANSYANQVRNMQATFAELGIALGESVLPIMTKLVEKVEEVVDGFRRFLVALGLIEGTAAEEFMKFVEVHRKIKLEVDQTTSALKKENDQYERLLELKDKADKGGLTFFERLEARKGFKGFRFDVSTADIIEDKIIAQFDELIKARDDAAKANTALTESEERGEQILRSASDVYKELAERIDKKLGKTKESGEATDDLSEKTDNLKTALNELDKKTGEVTEQFHVYEKAIVDGGQNISNALADMLVDGKFNLSGLADVFRNTMKQIIASYIQTQHVVPFLRNMGVPVSADAFGNVGFKGFAGGGAVSQPTIVGERGAELFIPHSAGVIKNNMDTKNMLGGSPVVVNQSINVDAGVAQTVRAEILTMMPMFKEQAMSAVLDARRRGGSFAATFGG